MLEKNFLFCVCIHTTSNGLPMQYYTLIPQPLYLNKSMERRLGCNCWIALLKFVTTSLKTSKCSSSCIMISAGLYLYDKQLEQVCKSIQCISMLCIMPIVSLYENYKIGFVRSQTLTILCFVVFILCFVAFILCYLCNKTLIILRPKNVVWVGLQ